MKFTIITVAYNAGDKLLETVQTVLSQTYTDWELIVKDGGSTDGSVEALLANPQVQRAEAGEAKIRVIRCGDHGIYDAMNQAVAYAQGDYVMFLNCGDYLYEELTLEQVAAYIDKTLSECGEEHAAGSRQAEDCSVESTDVMPGDSLHIFYGDTFARQTAVKIASPPEINGFTCYRNIPCHQSCFYRTDLCLRKPYDQSLRIRADYDHFLWCFYEAGAAMHYMDLIVASYEGGGYSESAENRKRDEEEHRLITEKYMSAGELRKYRTTMALTLAPLRKKLAESQAFSGIYHKLKEKLYHN